MSVQRFATLKRLYESGQIRRLGETEEIDFRTRIEAVAAAAEISTPLIIDATPERGHLHFYVTDPAISWFTNCGNGNAIYDSDLDAVFLDRSLWDPLELPKIGQSWPFTQEGRHFGFSRTFVDFILLHELGHRELHRSRWTLFDVGLSEQTRQKEIDADAFALNGLQTGYVKGLLGKDETTVEELAEIAITRALDPKQRGIISLLYSTAQMSVGLLFSRGSFSSLYTDSGHPSFGQRVEYMSRTLPPLYKDDHLLHPYINYFLQVSERMEAVRHQDLLELHTSSPVEAVQFDDRGLTILDTSWRVWHVDSADLKVKTSGLSTEPKFVGQIPLHDRDVYAGST